ncbi:hypothetical protein J7T55_004786 [Diaporthe amygdali]|uniref:uncharacterized protein n=1 Tax=Phomopsis amygdali TaxID=1214568 RepID=UPI0022FDF1DB|nr:uncharacterized protein J7T55_004786 [Diaporthe amygdali]KAJ0114542.1 hypothetical protein J7T55_004786 [Diaporthe amygdali]
MWGLLIIICWFFLILLELYVPVTRWEGIEVGKTYQYHGNSLVGWRQNILQFVPWIVLHPFAVLTGNLDYADYRNTLHWVTINQSHNEHNLNTLAQAVGQLRKILPELIKVDADIATSEWKVQDEFWHALNEEMKKGGLMWYLLSVHKDSNGSYAISDTHWDAIKQRIQNEDPLAMSNEVMSYVDTSVSKSFHDWLTKNADAVRKAQGAVKGEPSSSYTDLYGDGDKAVAARLKELGLEERVITREEFLSKIQELRDRDANVQDQMKVMNDKLGQALGIAMEAKNSAQLPPGLSRAEVDAIVAETVRRTVAEAQLEALAKGSIKSHLNSNLLAQKNYFSTIRGALVDPRLTSDTFDWRILRDAKQQGESKIRFFSLGSSKNDKEHPVFRRGGKYSGLPFAPSFALEKWEEDGECWCGGHKDDTHVVDLSIFTAASVVPQYLVVEHIDRGSTFDWESMPKELEFWIKAPEDSTQRKLTAWSKKHWGDAFAGPGWTLAEKGFVKVGQFDFDSGVGKGESQVFKLPNELVDYGIRTEQVLVRAKSNYGADDHTCFYRLRLFGLEPGEDKHDEASD